MELEVHFEMFFHRRHQNHILSVHRFTDLEWNRVLLVKEEMKLFHPF